MNNLPEIRDIHIPDGVSLFPLAYGWWVILLAVILLFVVIKLIMWSIKTSKKHYALKKLKQIETKNPVTSAIEISELLRRICTVKYRNASAFYGKEWIDFLNSKTSHPLSQNAAKLLMFAPFMKDNDKTYDYKTAEELKTFCQIWIGANL